jgi:hypothetical protein
VEKFGGDWLIEGKLRLSGVPIRKYAKQNTIDKYSVSTHGKRTKSVKKKGIPSPLSLGKSLTQKAEYY